MTVSQQESAYQQAAAAFKARNPASKQAYDAACDSLPGGNVRTVLYYDPFPLAIASAHGSELIDVDGHTYCDLLGEYTAGLYGHSDIYINKAITTALQRGLSYGGQHQDESRLAALIEKRIPSMDLLRFTNSGTEANLMNLALARAYTGKNKILVFNGCYHGGVLGWKGGKGSAVNAPFDFLIAKYNDIASVKALLAKPENANDVAAIILEPMAGSGGGIPATTDFLTALRHLATQHGTLLIFDEVMTSRMFEGGGIQSQLSANLRPDLTSLGKWIGGGMSFGAFGGRRDIMSLFDPRRADSIAHAGTFNNNVLTMAAGCAGMEQVFTPQRATQLHDRGNKLRQQLAEVCEGTLLRWTGMGSILCAHFIVTPAEEISCPDDLEAADSTLAGLLHLWLIENGFYIGRRGFLALSLVVTEEQLTSFVDAVRRFTLEFRAVLLLR